ncbi:MAG: FtsX-like permease family protein [Chloroflexi bacterium]|nr:MAG: FtsX-like permease family protein [Chloroflexota bacterium]
MADIGQTTARLANSVTSVDLASLVLVDVGFGVVIGSVGVALFLLAGLTERRREIATLEAIGAEPRHIRASLIGETTVVGILGIAIGVATGLIVGITLLQVLAGVFDPPPDAPVVPLVALAIVILAIGTGLALATAVADRGVARLGIVSALRER